MSSRSRDFVRSLSLQELKNIRVTIKRPNIPEPEDGSTVIYRAIEDHKSLRIHFKKESPRAIFDREDIVLNQEFPEETLKNSRNSRRRSSPEGEYERESRTRSVSYLTSSTGRIEPERLFRSRSRSGDRRRHRRSRSGSHRRSRSPSKRYKYNRQSSNVDRRSRSTSPRSQKRKQPGLFIPTESDYLKYKKKKLRQSRSSAESHSSKKDEYSSRSSLERYRSPRRRSRTPPRGRNRSNSPRRSRRSGSRSRLRSRSRSRHRYRNVKDVVPFGTPNMSTPHIFQHGNYWIPEYQPPFLPRGYIPHPMMYPRPFIPPPMNPHFRHQRMNSFRQRFPQPRQQTETCEVASTSSTVQPEADSHGGEK